MADNHQPRGTKRVNIADTDRDSLIGEKSMTWMGSGGEVRDVGIREQCKPW
jgi:hypothetical protein